MTSDIPIWLLVVQDLAGRDAKGKAEYGDSLRLSTDVDFLEYAYEEALDLAMYLKAEMEKRRAEEPQPVAKEAP